MTEKLFMADAYLQETEGTVLAHTPEGGLVLDQSLFYPTGGGQMGDQGHFGDIEITITVKGENGNIVLVPAEGQAAPAIGSTHMQRLNWDNRHRMMRLHTALHLLSVVIPLPVTGGQIRAEKARLDFAMPDPLADKQAVEDALNALITADHPVSEQWISEAELDAKPELVKTMSVQPPRGAGRIRLVRIGGEALVDLQPCGGTHVRSTGEIGKIRLGKMEKKGRLNRRLNVFLVE
ncbi:MAG TPA: alanyl-tRNA editing protein [Rhodobacteraceae bacterium]|nr:alanyl-tRNA editing protein [Paracoccaceae bacterium]